MLTTVILAAGQGTRMKSSRAKVLVEDRALHRARDRVAALLGRFPLYPELAID